MVLQFEWVWATEKGAMVTKVNVLHLFHLDMPLDRQQRKQTKIRPREKKSNGRNLRKKLQWIILNIKLKLRDCSCCFKTNCFPICVFVCIFVLVEL